MSRIAELLQELIDKLHGSKDKEHVGIAGDYEDEVSDDHSSEDDAKTEMLEKLAGESEDEHSDDIESDKPALKHNHPIMEECGPDCPMKSESEEE